MYRATRDLCFLRDTGVIATTVYQQLHDYLNQEQPQSLWIGYDYNDPLLKNFVRTPDKRLYAIDVESLVDDQLLGLGVAKALLRWMEPHRQVFFERYATHQAPDFLPYLKFVEIVHLAAYTKLMFVENKWAKVDTAQFTRFCP